MPFIALVIDVIIDEVFSRKEDRFLRTVLQVRHLIINQLIE